MPELFTTGDRVTLLVGVLCFLPANGTGKNYDALNLNKPGAPVSRILQPGEEFTFVRHRGEVRGGCAVRDSANLVWFVPTDFLEGGT
jgi:hypothetical protein